MGIFDTSSTTTATAVTPNNTATHRNNNNNNTSSSTEEVEMMGLMEDNFELEHKSKEPTNWLVDLMNRYNLTVGIVAVIFILIGLGTGLLAYFLLKRRDLKRAKSSMQLYSQTQADYLQKELDKSVLVSINLKGLFEVVPTVHYDTEFEPFINSTEMRTRNPGINTIAYCSQVKKQDMATHIAEIRQLGGNYENYTTFDLDENLNRIPLPDSDLYVPLLYSDPYYATIVGYDIGISVPLKQDAIVRARLSKKPAATSKTYFTVPGLGERPICEMYCPVVRNNVITGFTGVAFFISSMVDAAFSDYALTQVEVHLLDDQVSPDTDSHYLYGTKGQLDYNTYKKAIARARFSVSQTVYMADRRWKAVFLPTNTFMKANDGYEKWVALFVPLVVCVILSFIFALFIKGMEYSAKLRELTKDRVVILEHAQHKLQNLLNSIAAQEKKTRTIINTLADSVVVTDESGKILKVNDSFEKLFGLSEIEVHKTFTDICSLFVNTEKKILLDDNPLGVDLEAKNQFGKTFPVQVTSQSLPKQMNGAEEAYVISIKNMSDRQQLLKDLASQKARIKNLEEKAEFESEFATESFRKEIHEFCRKELNSENIDFLAMALEYKNAPYNKRVDMQLTVFNRFIKIGAQEQLNISKELSERIAYKIKKSKLADVDLFDPVEEFVKNMIVQDIYPRFKKYQEGTRTSTEKERTSSERERSMDQERPSTPQSPTIL